jgi:MFS transporter, PPP family, 3-phenylpropionic acid transporter
MLAAEVPMKTRPALPTAFYYFAMYTMWGVISPFLSILLENSGYSPRLTGYFLALYNCMGLVGPLVVGPFADRLGRPRLFLSILCLLVPASIFPLALAREPWITALSISLLSFGMWSMVPLADAFTSRLTRGESGAYGRIRSTGSLGFIAAGLILQLIPGFDAKSSIQIAVAAVPAVALSLAAILFLPSLETGAAASVLGAEATRGNAQAKHAPAGIESRIKPIFWIGLTVIALARLASIPFTSFLSLYVQNRVHWNVISGMWALGAMAELPFIFASGWFIKKAGLWTVILVALGAIVLRLGICLLFPTPSGVVSAQLLHSLCFGLFFPASVAFVSRTVPEGRRSLGMALNIGIGTGIPNLVGNAIGGNIIEKAGWDWLFLLFMIPAAIGIVVSIVFFKPLKAACAR